MSNLVITDIIKDLDRYLISINPLIHILDGSFKSLEFDSWGMSVDTYSNICRQTYKMFGPEDFIENYNLKTLLFFEKLLEKYPDENNEKILEEMKKINYKNRHYYDCFVYLVKLLNVLKKYRHPIYIVSDFLRIFPFEDENGIAIKNIVSVLFNIVELENRKRRLMEYQTKFGIFHRIL